MNKKTEKKCTLIQYYAAINFLCYVIADVVDVNMKTRSLTSNDRAVNGKRQGVAQA